MMAMLAAAVDPAPVVAAERAFAADGLAHGIKASFLAHSAPDAVVLQPDPVKAQASFAGQPDDSKGPALVWWPTWAGIARSGDLGFTTGPYTYAGRPGGYYFTVWARQPDGGWKWIFDGGAPADPKGAPPQGAQPDYLPLADAQSGSPEAAMQEVSAQEAELAAQAAKDVSAAYLGHLAADGRIQGSPAPPATGPAAFAKELATRPQAISFTRLDGRASQAGDLAFTYGDARWAQDGQDRRGHYVRIWQKRATGWRLAFDEIVPVPPAKPPAKP